MIDCVESPAITGPVTVYPEAVIVSWPSFSASVIRAMRVSMRLIGDFDAEPKEASMMACCRATIGRVRRR